MDTEMPPICSPTLDSTRTAVLYASVAVLRMLLRAAVSEEFRLLTSALDRVIRLYRSSSTSYSVSVTLELTSMPSLEMNTWTVSQRDTCSACATS